MGEYIHLEETDDRAESTMSNKPEEMQPFHPESSSETRNPSPGVLMSRVHRMVLWFSFAGVIVLFIFCVCLINLRPSDNANRMAARKGQLFAGRNNNTHKEIDDSNYMSLHNRVEELRTKLNQMESKESTDVATLRTRITELESQNNNQIAELRTRIAALETQNHDRGDDISELRAKLSELGTTTQGIPDGSSVDISGLRSRIDDLEAQDREELSTLRDKITELQTSEDEDIVDLKTRVASLESAASQTVSGGGDGGRGGGSGGGGASTPPSGQVYVRWGRTSCPASADLVYHGISAGAYFMHDGSGSNYQCLPHDPEWGRSSNTTDSFTGLLYGVEYQFYASNPFSTVNSDGQVLTNHDAPCAVCHTTARSGVMVIPAKRTCYPGWTLEYRGYLVSNSFEHRKTEYVCLDEAPEVLEEGGGDQNGGLFYNVEARCGALPCPPYKEGEEFTCVVCSK